jgi:hypothetical protein
MYLANSGLISLLPLLLHELKAKKHSIREMLRKKETYFFIVARFAVIFLNCA